MITITVDNSYSRIEGLTNEAFRSLKKALSYEVDPQQAFYQGGHRPRTKSLLDAKGHFPTGLLHRVMIWGGGHIAVKHRRIVPKDSAKIALDLKGRDPYSCQLAAMNAATLLHRGVISMPTGTGKSVVISLLIYAFQVRTLIVVPTLELKRQLIESLESVHGPKISKFVVVENVDSGNLKNLTNFDMLIIDEGHHVAASTYHKLNKTAWKNIYYRFFLTATPFRNQTNEHLLFEAIAGQIIFKLSYKDAVARKHIVPVEAYYIEIPKQKVNGFTWAEVYKELVTSNDVRNGMLAGLLGFLTKNDKSVLCLVKEVAHGKALSLLSGVPFANGADDDSRQYIRQFASGGIPALIGTTGIVSEGCDTKPCEYVIIAGLGKAKSGLMQCIGRAVRAFPLKETAKVFLLKDRSHRWTLRHFNEQKKILVDEYGVEPIKLTL